MHTFYMSQVSHLDTFIVNAPQKRYGLDKEAILLSLRRVRLWKKFKLRRPLTLWVWEASKILDRRCFT